MSTYQNVVPAPPTDGIVYANALAVPATEGDIFNGSGPDPIPITYHMSFLAFLTLTYGGTINSNSTYIVAQTSLDGKTWVDVAWITDTSTTGVKTFVMAGGQDIGANFAFTRASGSTPSGGNSGNAMPLGGQLRFVGQTTLSGTLPTCKVSLTYKLRGIR